MHSDLATEDATDPRVPYCLIESTVAGDHQLAKEILQRSSRAHIRLGVQFWDDGVGVTRTVRAVEHRLSC